MRNRLLVAAIVAAGLAALVYLLPTNPVGRWSQPSVSAADCAVPSSVSASQPSNGLITVAFNAAGFNGLFPGHQYFGSMALESGPSGARSLRQPYVPPTLLKAIGWIEASWRQANGSGPLISFDCGYGIMQITAPGVFPLEGIGMVYRSPDTGIYEGAQVPIATSYTHNIAFGVKTLIGKWNLAPEWRPVVGSGNPDLIEDWYYAVWSYNGFVSSNHPDGRSALRGEYSCNGSDSFNHNRTEFPYQELVLGCVKHPPLVGGVALWPSIPVSLPALVPPFSGYGEGMDIATPQPFHGDPTSGASPAPLTIDAPAAAAVGQPFNINGWSVDYATPSGTGIDAIHVYAYPSDSSGTPTGPPRFLGEATLGGSRPDVATFFGNPGFVGSGFNLTARGLAPGFQHIVVYARSTVTGTWAAGNRVVRVWEPPMALDGPAAGSSVQQPVLVTGWAIDPSAVSGTGVDAVHVYAYPSDASGVPTGAPVFLGSAPYGGSRPDVAGLYGGQFLNSGYNLFATGLPAGYHHLVTYARSTESGVWNQRHRVINVPEPAMAFDTPASGSTAQQPFLVAGWALDHSAAGGTGVDAVHVYAFPSNASGVPTGAQLFLGAASYGSPRPDVGSVHGGQFTNSGYLLNVSGLTGGLYHVIVYARSTVTGRWNEAHRVFAVSP